jgi:hypothetical protein
MDERSTVIIMKTRIRPALGIARKNAPHVLAGGKAIYNAMLGHAEIFTACNPPLPTLLTQIQALDSAQQAAATRAKGLAAVRDQCSAELYTSLQAERMYVQSLSDASPEQATTIILAAGMKVATIPVRNKPVIGAALGSSPHSVVLRANVTALVGAAVAKTKRYFFNWSQTEDGGKTWSTPTQTNEAMTTLTNLTPVTVHGFRVCATVRSVTGPWTDMVTLLVP